jgi:hypothetical protein
MGTLRAQVYCNPENTVASGVIPDGGHAVPQELRPDDEQDGVAHAIERLLGQAAHDAHAQPDSHRRQRDEHRGGGELRASKSPSHAYGTSFTKFTTAKKTTVVPTSTDFSRRCGSRYTDSGGPPACAMVLVTPEAADQNNPRAADRGAGACTPRRR